jgi:hypothetical protein
MEKENRRIEILKHQWNIEAKLSNVFPADSFEKIYSKRASDGLRGPADVHRRAVYWAWLRWHLDADFETISDVLTADVLRAAKAFKRGRIPKGADERGFHDWLMLCAAVLSGNTKTMRTAAGQVQLADARRRNYQYYEALAGIVASHIKGDQKKERVQFQILQRHNPIKIDPWPSEPLLRSFIDRNFKGVAKAVKTGAEKHWSDLYLGRRHRRSWRIVPVVVKEDRKSMLLDLRSKDSYFWWPYVEAVFAKLALLDGAVLSYDSFWLPLAFLQATNNPMTSIKK